MPDSPFICGWQRSVRINELSRHLRNDVDALSRTIDFARKAPDAIPFIRDNRFLFGVVPSHYIHKTSLNAGFTASTFIQINLDIGTHAPSKTEFRSIVNRKL
jgi:hypothetical protein